VRVGVIEGSMAVRESGWSGEGSIFSDEVLDAVGAGISFGE